MKKFFAYVSLVFLLVACKSEFVTTPNGEVPNEYLSYAQSWVGEYVGAFDGRSNSLEISLQGLRPVLSFKNDPAGPNCQSVIGNLEDFYFYPDSKLVEAHFSFDANFCSAELQGKILTLRLPIQSSVKNVEMSIVKKTYFVNNCDNSDHGCQAHYANLDARGKFVRQ